MTVLPQIQYTSFCFNNTRRRLQNIYLLNSYFFCGNRRKLAVPFAALFVCLPVPFTTFFVIAAVPFTAPNVEVVVLLTTLSAPVITYPPAFSTNPREA